MVKTKNSPSPNLLGDVVFLCFKIFFAIFLVTNIVWTIIYFKPHGSRVEINQSGHHDIVHQVSAE